MASWRTIAASEVDQDSPVTQTLMQAYKDNPTAIAEGASGAPAIENAAHKAPTAAATVVARLTPTGDELLSLVGTVYGNALIWATVLVPGTVRIAFDVKAVVGSAKFKVEINGASVFSGSTGSGTFVAQTTDQAVALGDCIAIYVAGNSSGTDQGSARNAMIRSGGGNFCVA